MAYKLFIVNYIIKILYPFFFFNHFRRWLWEHNKLEFLEKKAKRSKRAQTFLRRFTVSARTRIIRKESITKSEVSIFDDRRKTVVNKIDHMEQKGPSF